MKNLAVLNSDRKVALTVNATMGTSQDPGIDRIECDLLVLTSLSMGKPTAGLLKVDDAAGGKVLQAMNEGGFEGRSDQSVLVDCRGTALGAGHVLVLGLGRAGSFSGRTVCELLGRTMEAAATIEAGKVVLPVMPNRGSAERINLAGSAAILACRVGVMSAEGKTGAVRDLELFSTPQAGRYLLRGLNPEGRHCVNCPFAGK